MGKMNRSYFNSVRRVEVSENVAKDANLSMKARGLMLTIAGLPEDFDITEASLSELVPDGKTAVGNAVKELVENGYLVKKRKRREHGKAYFESGEWDVMV